MGVRTKMSTFLFFSQMASGWDESRMTDFVGNCSPTGWDDCRMAGFEFVLEPPNPMDSYENLESRS